MIETKTAQIMTARGPVDFEAVFDGGVLKDFIIQFDLGMKAAADGSIERRVLTAEQLTDVVTWIKKEVLRPVILVTDSANALVPTSNTPNIPTVQQFPPLELRTATVTTKPTGPVANEPEQLELFTLKDGDTFNLSDRMIPFKVKVGSGDYLNDRSS